MKPGSLRTIIHDKFREKIKTCQFYFIFLKDIRGMTNILKRKKYIYIC